MIRGAEISPEIIGTTVQILQAGIVGSWSSADGVGYWRGASGGSDLVEAVVAAVRMDAWRLTYDGGGSFG